MRQPRRRRRSGAGAASFRRPREGAMKRVLIAEDDPSIVLSLEYLLSEAGYEVYTATNGADALALAEAHTPDLLVLDIMMPAVNGFEVCRSVRANAALRGLRIL